MSNSRSPFPRPRAGLILSAMVALCLGLVLIPITGSLIILHQHGMLSVSVFVHLFMQPSAVTKVVIIPSILLFALAVVFIIAFFLRAPWGPGILSALAMIWACCASLATILVPMLAMPGGLPMLTAMNMVPAILSPLLFALSFVGFLLQSEGPRRWFAQAGTRPGHE